MQNQRSQVLARDVMVPVKKLVTLKPDMDALAAIRMLLSHRISGAPVVDHEGAYLGVFSEKTSMDFLLQLTYEDLPSSDVSSFMNTDFDRTIPEEADLLSIMDIFLRSPYRRLPVLHGDRLVGQISRRDVLRAATKSLEQLPTRRKHILYLSALESESVAASRFWN